MHAPSDGQRAGIEGALALWRTHGVGTVSMVEGIPASAGVASGVIELRFESAAPQFYGLYDDETSVMYVNTAVADPGPMAVVIAHELGHAFGLPHIPAAVRRSLMNPGNFETPPTDEDLAEIEALWGRCAEAGRKPR